MTSSRPRELLEEIGDREAVGGGVGHVVDLGVRRAVQRGDVAAVHHVAVAAARRHARPLVAHEDHAAAVGVDSARSRDAGAATRPRSPGSRWPGGTSCRAARCRARMRSTPRSCRCRRSRGSGRAGRPRTCLGSADADGADQIRFDACGRRCWPVMRVSAPASRRRRPAEPRRRRARRSTSARCAGRPSSAAPFASEHAARRRSARTGCPTRPRP